jgi:hypothetical protein
MPGIGLTDNPALGGARVDTNHDLGVALQPDEAEAGFAAITAESNPDGVGIGRRVRALEASADYRLRIGMDAFLFRDNFSHAQINTSKYRVTNTTMTNALSGGRWILNASLSTASGVGTQVQSYSTFSYGLSGCLYADFEAGILVAPQANCVIELGLFQCSGVTSPVDGVLFRLNAAGTWDGVIVNNSAETSVALVSASGVSYVTEVGELHHFTIAVHNDSTDFWIDDVLVGRINTPVALGSPMATMSQPITARLYNSGVVSLAQQLLLSAWSVTSGDVDSNRLWPTMQAVMGNSAINVPDGTAPGQTASIVLSTAPVTCTVATMISTVACYQSLGGQFALSQIASAETEVIVFDYTNPAQTQAIPGKNLVIRGITIDAYSEGVVGSALGIVQQWGLGVGGTTSTLAAVDSATAGTRGFRKVTLGFIAFPASAAIGALATRIIDINLDAPIVCEPGCHVAITMKPIKGPSNAGQIIRGTCFVNGYFE